MKPTGGSVEEFIAEVTPQLRQRDARTLLTLLGEVSGREPELWGTIVGFGRCHYRYPTGNEGEMPVLAFSPRKAASTVYLDRADRHTEALAALGPHTSSKACLYLKDLQKVDSAVLRGILIDVLTWTEAGGDENVEITITD